MNNELKVNDKVFLINPEGLFNKAHWVETVIVKIDDNGEDFFTADAVMWDEEIMCEVLAQDDNCFSLIAEGKTWWRADAIKPSVEEASKMAKWWWYND